MKNIHEYTLGAKVKFKTKNGDPADINTCISTREPEFTCWEGVIVEEPLRDAQGKIVTLRVQQTLEGAPSITLTVSVKDVVIDSKRVN